MIVMTSIILIAFTTTGVGQSESNEEPTLVKKRIIAFDLFTELTDPYWKAIAIYIPDLICTRAFQSDQFILQNRKIFLTWKSNQESTPNFSDVKTQLEQLPESLEVDVVVTGMLEITDQGVVLQIEVLRCKTNKTIISETLALEDPTIHPSLTRYSAIIEKVADQMVEFLQPEPAEVKTIYEEVVEEKVIEKKIRKKSSKYEPTIGIAIGGLMGGRRASDHGNMTAHVMLYYDMEIPFLSFLAFQIELGWRPGTSVNQFTMEDTTLELYDVDMSTKQFPFFLNLFYKWEVAIPFLIYPYAGAGIGLEVTHLDISSENQRFVTPYFVYQAGAHVHFNMGKNLWIHARVGYHGAIIEKGHYPGFAWDLGFNIRF